MTDLWLAIAHHALVFGLAIMLTAEAVRLRNGMSGAEATRLAKLDAGYGATAGLVIVVGVLRVIYGARGHVFYVENVWFWAKMACFAAMGLLSIPPTFRFRAWQKAAKTDPSFAPRPDDIRGVKAFIHVQLLMILFIVAFAATMARYTSI